MNPSTSTARGRSRSQRFVEAITLMDRSSTLRLRVRPEPTGMGPELPGQPLSPPLLSPSISNQLSAWDLEAAYQHGSERLPRAAGRPAACESPHVRPTLASPAAGALLPAATAAAAAAPRVGAIPIAGPGDPAVVPGKASLSARCDARCRGTDRARRPTVLLQSPSPKIPVTIGGMPGSSSLR